MRMIGLRSDWCECASVDLLHARCDTCRLCAKICYVELKCALNGPVVICSLGLRGRAVVGFMNVKFKLSHLLTPSQTHRLTSPSSSPDNKGRPGRLRRLDHGDSSANLVHWLGDRAYDRSFSTLFSTPLTTTSEANSGLTHEEILRVIRTGGGFASGCGIEYSGSPLVDTSVRGMVTGGARESGLLWPAGVV